MVLNLKFKFNGNTPLIEAAESGHTETVKVIFGAGADLDTQNFVSL
jgi:hypothetical protein